MKIDNLFYVIVFLFLFSQAVFASTSIELEFQDFFKEPLNSYKDENVSMTIHDEVMQDGRIVVDGVSEQIQVTVTFNIKSVGKVLVLKVPESGYMDDGSFDKDCSDDYVFVAGYTIDPDINISEITFRMRSRCIGQRTRLVVWVRDATGNYYMGKKEFRMYASHQTLNW